MFRSPVARIATLLFSTFAIVGLAGADVVRMPGLESAVQVTRDDDGIAHIKARRSRDLYFMQGYVHASDRLFQMDLTRRQPSGTLAELFGPAALGGDVEVRTIGLRRAAERSYAALSVESREALEAYAAGVNRWVEDNPLPPEYGLLGLGSVDPWTPVDSVVIAKAIAFSLSFDFDIGLTERITAYLSAPGVDGLTLFQEDVFRSMPFDCASTVPDATGEFPFLAAGDPDTVPNCISDGGSPVVAAEGGAIPAPEDGIDAPVALASMAAEVGQKVRRSDFIRRVLDADGAIGSNEWGVTSELGSRGLPVIANDPHLSLDTPSTFYPIHLMRPGLNVFGSSFAGIPFVVLGINRHVQWGATTNPMDVTDTFFELVGLTEEGDFYTVFQGVPEPVQPVPEVFRFNNGNGGTAVAPPGPCQLPGCGQGVAIPQATLIVPRRNNGPIIALLDGTPTPAGEPVPALSVQYTGFSATREIDTFRIWNEARDLEDFQRGLQFFDFGSQNWVYADVHGNTAYFTSAEMPIRADLQQGAPAPGQPPGFPANSPPVPPWFVRDGVNGQHEWLEKTTDYAGQAIPYEILGPDEMPQTINPSMGYFVNANNDPAGTTLDNNPLNQLRTGGQGLYYLNPGYAGGFRAGTITLRLRETIADAGQVSAEDMQRIQADVTMLDSRYFVPLILQAWERAESSTTPELEALAADGRLAEAVERLAAWDYSTPTGIRQGYDAGDDPDNLPMPSAEEVANSIAATIYSVWRGQAIAAIVDETLGGLGLPGPGSAQAMSALKNLFDNFPARQGEGASGVDFFAVADVDDPADRRDIKLLGALQSALDKLAGPDFEPAFAGSTDQDDYRWGRLHWIVFEHPFVDAFGVPPQLGEFPPPLAPEIPGIPTDGGFGVVDASSHGARAARWDQFDFSGGPVRRFVGEPESRMRNGRAESIWAGGTSGVPAPGNPFYSNLLPRWLVNDTVALELEPGAVRPGAGKTVYVPAGRR